MPLDAHTLCKCHYALFITSRLWLTTDEDSLVLKGTLQHFTLAK